MTTHTELTFSGKLIAEAIVSALNANAIVAKVEKTYFDFGQDWTWDTIVAQSKSGSYQVLNPRQQKAMNDNTFDYAEINDIVKQAKALA